MTAVATLKMECQVVVVGDAKVGKSAIIRRLTQNHFTEVITPVPPKVQIFRWFCAGYLLCKSILYALLDGELNIFGRVQGGYETMKIVFKQFHLCTKG